MQIKNKPPRYGFLERLQDFAVLFKGTWFIVLFDLLAVVVFVVVPQGSDVLLAVAEDLANKMPATAAWLAVGILLWSIASRFCARFLISLSDNSGRSLSPRRVEARKRNQAYMSQISLFFPVFIVSGGIIKTMIANWADISSGQGASIVWGLLGLLLLMAVFGVALYYLFFTGVITSLSKRVPGLSWLQLPGNEKYWSGKLYGIFNDVRVDIPKNLAHYPNDELPAVEINKDGTVPHGSQPLPNGMILPKSDYFEKAPGYPLEQQGTPIKTWLYIVRLPYFKVLLTQFFVLVGIATIVILLFSFILPSGAYLKAGTLAIFCLAFGCWQVIYCFWHLLDKVQKWVPFRVGLFILFALSSYFNDDHPARLLPGNSGNRPSLQEHFSRWVKHLALDSANEDYYRVIDGRDTLIPVVFVAAEGGALRTGAFTDLMLSQLSDKFPLLPKYIYCYSSVSGGTVGANTYNANVIHHWRINDTAKYSSGAISFYKGDYLAALAGKLAFGEIINYFIPKHIDRLDRAIALEEAWQSGWENAHKEDHILEEPFTATVADSLAAVFINTTEVETGSQCLWSNVRLDGIPLGHLRDLNSRMDTAIRYSTAINLSSRFPIFSPGAAFFYRDTSNDKYHGQKLRVHYVDGGYYENKGAETLLQVLQALPLKQMHVKPYVLQFSFGEDDSTFATGVHAANEILEIVAGIYNTRGGRGAMAQYYLNQYLAGPAVRGEFINLQLTLSKSQFPVNWVLSNTSVNRLAENIRHVVYKEGVIDPSDRKGLQRLFLYQENPLPKKP